MVKHDDIGIYGVQWDLPIGHLGPHFNILVKYILYFVQDLKA